MHCVQMKLARCPGISDIMYAEIVGKIISVTRNRGHRHFVGIRGKLLTCYYGNINILESITWVMKSAHICNRILLLKLFIRSLSNEFFILLQNIITNIT